MAVMPQRGRLCGDQLWKLNMAACGVGGAPMRYMGPLRLGLGGVLHICEV
jgi:hypothetical protein